MFKKVEYAGFDDRPELKAQAERATGTLGDVMRSWRDEVWVSWKPSPFGSGALELALSLALANASGMCRPGGTVGAHGDGETREGTGHRYKAGQKLVPVRWVLVRDQTGTHRHEYFFTTDASASPTDVIGYYCGRWSIETTLRSALVSGLGNHPRVVPEGGAARRAGPCLLGRYSVVAVLFHALPESKRTGAVAWPGKATVTSSDAACAIRRWRWAETRLPPAGEHTGRDKLPTRVRERPLTTLAPAA